jgi:hypothetical protein
MEGKASTGNVQPHGGVLCDVPDVGLAEAGDEAALGLEGTGLAPEVGAEDVDAARALVERYRLGILGLSRVAVNPGMQPLYLPILVLGGAATVADGRDAVFDFPLVQYGPEPDVPTVLREQSLVSYGQ